ncbi:GntR family transcriptional regulator [Roseomonas sp. M0104]|uniref:GntR family transcriptional regulator n=1 Tax=Teichococcus coralli TaxID=2545983 RepID=A0A845BBQ4_9PROT|nr:GntR family transcriptional regulator [Pseudoroseomonas coralli]MXP64265.1 GntR family transcriptional regulator [Pseudoroseomonas coralli]
MSLPEAFAGPPPLEEQAYRQLRQALVEGTFTPGDKLSLRRLAAALGTSPMPVRAALRRLAAEQALDMAPSGTAVVPRLTRAAFLELGEVRAALEPLALRFAAPRLDAATLDRLALLLPRHAASRTDGKPEEFLRADREFLFTLYRRAEAPLLLGMIESLWLRRGPLFWEARWMLMSRPAEAAHRHAQILEALRAGDGAGAAAELEAEIREATAFLLGEIRFDGDASKAPEVLPVLRPGR